MNSMENTHSSASAPMPDTQCDQVIADAGNLINEFERLLASELHLLESGQAEGLEAIALAKETLVGQISAQEAMLIEVFEHHPQLPAVMNVKARLKKCRSDNQNNHALVMLELKHANRSLELLRSVLRMDDLSLYREDGVVSVIREKRKIGSA